MKEKTNTWSYWWLDSIYFSFKTLSWEFITRIPIPSKLRQEDYHEHVVRMRHYDKKIKNYYLWKVDSGIWTVLRLVNKSLAALTRYTMSTIQTQLKVRGRTFATTHPYPVPTIKHIPSKCSKTLLKGQKQKCFFVEFHAALGQAPCSNRQGRQKTKR